MTEIRAKIEFILELEKLKAVLRKTKPVGIDRFENSAEHSWQTALTALLFLDETNVEIDALKVLKMLLIHDVVEIDTGDVFVYDDKGREDIAREEAAAAERIFGMLPSPLSQELLGLWNEFENRSTKEAVFAKAIDRVNPVLQNLAQNGQSWVENGVVRERVIAKNSEIHNASPQLWTVLHEELENAGFFDSAE